MIDIAKPHTNGKTPPAVQPPHIFLGLSSHDSRVHSRFMMSLISLVASGRFKVTVSNVSSGGIHKARNNLAWEFLTKCDAEYYLSVDSDIGFTPDNVSRLLWQIQNNGVSVVGGPYCHKKPGLEWSARAIEGMTPDPTTGLQELSAHGTGFLMIKREVFEKIRREHPELAHIEDWSEGRGDTKWDFFSEGVVQEELYYPKPTFLSEDFYFCKRARDAGFKIYVDTTFHVMHWDGGRGYPETPPPQTSLEQAAPLTVNERFKL